MPEEPSAALARILIERSYHRRTPPQEPFVLASGKTSWHYFECQRTTSFALALPLIGRAFYERILPGVEYVGGLTRGADPIADAIAYYSAVSGTRPISTFSVRKERKDHGTTRWVEGSASAGDQVAIVDDVLTSGGSVIKAIERSRSEGLVVHQVLVIVDREEQAGMDAVRRAAGEGVPVEALFRFSDLAHLATELDSVSG